MVCDMSFFVIKMVLLVDKIYTMEKNRLYHTASQGTFYFLACIYNYYVVIITTDKNELCGLVSIRKSVIYKHSYKPLLITDTKRLINKKQCSSLSIDRLNDISFVEIGSFSKKFNMKLILFFANSTGS